MGDVLDKALRRTRLTVDAVARAAGVLPERLRDAIDYRGELGAEELCRLAAVLRLNEVGLCALGAGKYPLPAIGALPFSLWPLRMTHGIGVANAYLVGAGGSGRALLFDTGAGIEALDAVWPRGVREIDAVFLTQIEREHVGGLCDIVARFRVSAAFAPRGAEVRCGTAVGEAEVHEFGGLRVRTLATPGHTAVHNCYLVEPAGGGGRGSLLVTGDLLFAGSVGGANFSPEQITQSLQRILRTVPPETVVAPGHGPLTTVAHELRYNPFCGGR